MLNVEDDLAYVTPMSDTPTLVDGEEIAGRRRLRRNSALTFGGATFRVQYEGPNEETESKSEETEWEVDESEWEQETQWSADESEAQADETPLPSAPAAPQRSLQDPPRVEARPTAEARRAATPHISPRIEREARVDLRVRRRRRTGWIAWVVVAATIAACSGSCRPVWSIRSDGTPMRVRPRSTP